ncbi:MAG TPA: HypC/HybG/HupF family hydrogenase formation chaperone [Solirubrobacteraceae bacterium]|jgi:hydrogenase maturation factor
MNDPVCDQAGHCITCGDEAIPMQVLESREGNAVCVDSDGTRHEVAVELIGPVTPDQRVLVHAGVAIA